MFWGSCVKNSTFVRHHKIYTVGLSSNHFVESSKVETILRVLYSWWLQICWVVVQNIIVREICQYVSTLSLTHSVGKWWVKRVRRCALVSGYGNHSTNLEVNSDENKCCLFEVLKMVVGIDALCSIFQKCFGMGCGVWTFLSQITFVCP